MLKKIFGAHNCLLYVIFTLDIYCILVKIFTSLSVDWFMQLSSAASLSPSLSEEHYHGFYWISNWKALFTAHKGVRSRFKIYILGTHPHRKYDMEDNNKLGV